MSGCLFIHGIAHTPLTVYHTERLIPLEKHMPTTERYAEMVKNTSGHSPSWKNIPLAFLIGGTICTIGEGLLHLYQFTGLTADWAGAMVSVTLIAASGLLTGLGVYDKIAKLGGAGTLVPITGFANAVVSPALEFKSEGLVLGTSAKMFLIAGPVIVYGLAASAIYGVILCLLGQAGM